MMTSTPAVKDTPAATSAPTMTGTPTSRSITLHMKAENAKARGKAVAAKPLAKSRQSAPTKKGKK